MKAEQLGNSYERLKMIGNFRPEPILKGDIKSLSDQIFLQETLLRKSADERISPYPRRIYPTAFVTGMPGAV